MFCTNCGAENPENNRFCINCGNTLESAEESGASQDLASPPQPQTNSRWFLIGGAVLLGILLIAGAVILLPRLSGGREMLLAEPNRNGETDLIILRLGQEEEEKIVLVENVLPGDITKGVAEASSPYFTYEYLPRPYGGFIPGTDRLLISYREDDETILIGRRISQDENIEYLDSDSTTIFTRYSPEQRTLYIRESQDDNARCYVGSLDEEADRVARGDNCYTTLDFSHVVVHEENSDGESSLTIMSADGSNERTVIEDVMLAEEPGGFRVSYDASFVAYIERDGPDKRVILVESESGDEIEASDEFPAIASYGFAGDSNQLYYVADNGEGELELHLAGNSSPLATAYALYARESYDGRYLFIVLGDEDPERRLIVYDLQSGQQFEVTSGDNLLAGEMVDPQRIIVREEDGEDIILYSADVSGSNLVELFADEMRYSSLQYVRGGDRLFLEVQDDEGRSYLYVSSINEPDGYYLLEDWYELQILSLSDDGRQLVFRGQEDSGDDPVLYIVAVEGGQPVELDDDQEDFTNAVFSPDGRKVIYSAKTGSDEDEVAVYEMSISGDESPTRLYDGFYLIDARWTDMSRFEGISLMNAYYTAEISPSANFTREVLALVPYGNVRGAIFSSSELSDFRLGSGYGDLYSFRGSENDRIVLNVYAPSIGSTMDPYVELFDDSFTRLASDDDSGDSYDSRLRYTLPRDGDYYVLVRSAGDRYGSASDYYYELVLGYE